MIEPLPPLSESAKLIRPGFYEHYKGKQYQVLGVARHSETLEELVVYQVEYGDRSLWIRPVGMFDEKVDVEGTPTLRFRFLHD